MSLICHQTQKDIIYGEPLYAAEAPNGSTYALSAQVVDKIHPENRHSDGEIKIYSATAGRNYNGSYMWSDFSQGELLFRISRQTAAQCFPRILD